ncbi:MAG: peptide chain release factor N(5)-glutamine methyltransferase [Bacteroidales bacterium]|nr:peptide chain release factor N(5)-glutamine methyltransferase [Bacteroidales bacterium]
MLLAQFIREGTAALGALYDPREAAGLVQRLCNGVLGVSSYAHIVEPSLEVPPCDLPRLQEGLARLLAGEPLQYVLGYQEFCGRRFKVGPAVLIPRPETEELAAVASVWLRQGGGRALDLCTGSGCIAWTLALDAPGSAVTAVDISDAALSIARRQFDNSRESQPCFIMADVLKVPEEFPGAPFDVLTANPPYIRESEKQFMHRNVLEHEPELALFVPDADPLLFYRATAEWARRFLKPEGRGIVEINEQLGAETAAVFEAAGLKEVTILRDFRQKERFISFSK